MLELRNPTSKYSLIFSLPLREPSGDEEEIVPWQRLEIRKGTAKSRVAMDLSKDGPHSAVAPYWDRDELWSPDGLYAVLMRSSRVRAHGTMDPFQLEFFGLENGRAALFQAGNEYASTDNFLGWKAGAPHTMLITVANQTLEAQPGN